jgi:hypothetical protein
VDDTLFEAWITSHCIVSTVLTLCLCSMHNLTFIHSPSSSGLSREIPLNDGVHSNFQVHDLFLFSCWVHVESGEWVGELDLIISAYS